MAVTLNVQNDDGTTANANSLLSKTAFEAYCELHGYSLSGKTADQINIALIVACDYLNIRFRYKGERRRGRDQTTEFPRSNLWDKDRFYVTVIPQEAKDAQAEYAFRALSGTLLADPEVSASGAVVQSKTETVGPISESVTYVGGAAYSMPRYPLADQKLLKAGFVMTGGTLKRG
jgi:hypothetical protein